MGMEAAQVAVGMLKNKRECTYSYIAPDIYSDKRRG